MSLLDKIDSLDRRVIYILFMVLTAVPLIRPIGIPIPVSNKVTEYYNMIQSLPEGATVVVDYGMTLGEWGSCGQGAIPIIKMLTDRLDINIIFVDFTAQTEIVIEKMINEMPDRFESRTYGENWVVMGFVAGGETAIAAYGDDVWNTAPVDKYGTPASEIPLLANIRSAEDIEAVFPFANWAAVYWVRQVQSKHGTKILALVAVMDETQMVPYYDAGQIAALVAAERDGAQFEILLGEPGVNIAKMDSNNIGFALFLTLLAISNISAFLRRRK